MLTNDNREFRTKISPNGRKKRYYKDNCINCGKEKWVKIDKLNKKCHSCAGTETNIKRFGNKKLCSIKGCKNMVYYSVCKYHRRRQRQLHKIKARWIVHNALADNRLKKYPCNTCGDSKSEAHHPNYEYPLQVLWYCREHHREVHGGQFVAIAP